MPNVAPNSQVAHLWAHQAQPSARSHNGNYWFEGDTLYSYSTPIARIVENDRGARVALVTRATYSVTTSSKHMGPIHRATDYGRFIPMYRVLSLGAFGGRHRHDRRGIVDHDMNLAAYRDDYARELARLGRVRDFNHIDALASLNRIANPYSDYCEAFSFFDAPPMDTDADAQRLADAWAARQTPAAIAKRERAAAARAASKAAREAREHAKRAAREAAWHDAFRSGLPYYGPALRDANGGALLRTNGDTLETSLGAQVPLAHAIKAFRFVKLCRERGEGWHRNGHTVRVGHFTVDRIEANGDFRAGCHFIAWTECERLARELGVFDDAPSAEAVESTHA